MKGDKDMIGYKADLDLKLQIGNSARRCGSFLYMLHAAWSMCLRGLRTRVSCAKTVEPIEMVRLRLVESDSCAPNEPRIRWGPDPHGKETF